MPQTFDPRPLGGGPACVQALRELDVRVSQRLGARLFALGRRGIQLSLALLESAAPGSELEAFLLDDRWNAAAPDDIAAVVSAAATPLRSVIEDGTVKVVAPDEVDEPVALAVAAPPASPLVASVLGAGPLPQGALWSRERVEQAALTLLDSEDATELVENLRYLFRATHTAGADPVPLLITALRRRLDPVAREVAALVRAHLDRDLGRALEDLLDADPTRVRDAIFYLVEVQRDGRHGGARELALPALSAVLDNAAALRQVVAALPDAVHLIDARSDAVEPFLEAILDRADTLEAPERFAVSRFLLAIQEPYPGVIDFLTRRMRLTADPQMQAFYGNVLARSRLTATQRSELSQFLCEAFVLHGRDTALQKRLKATFLALGAEPLAILTATPQLHRMDAGQRAFLADLWGSATDRPDAALLAAFAVAEVGARNHGATVNLLRTRLLHHAAVVAFLRENEWARPTLIQVLLDDALRLEDPDDLALFDFLGALGMEAAEAAFERAREEATLDSRSAPHRFRVFAHVAARVPPDGALQGLVEQCLAFPFLVRSHLPASLDALGALGSVAGLPAEIVEEIVARLLPPIATEVAPEFTARASLQLEASTEQRMQAALAIYRGGAASDACRALIEERLEGIVADPAPPRKVLVAALGALERLLADPVPPLRVESMALTLARVVFRKSREASLDHVLADAVGEAADPRWLIRDRYELSDQFVPVPNCPTSQQGVRVLEPWGKDDRDQALVILGKVAGHAAVPDGLHRMMTARLASFLEDWLDAQEGGRDLYLHRDTPLWGILLDVVRARPSEHSLEAVVRAGLRAMEVHRKAPQTFGLERREDAQRLIAELVWLAPQEPVEIRGSLRLDIPQAALQTLLTLATRENPTASRILEEISREPRFPPRLLGKLQAFLNFRRHP